MEQHSYNPAPSLAVETLNNPARELAAVSAEHPANFPAEASASLATEQSPQTAYLDNTGIQIIRATRSWIQFGMVGFAVICIVIGAVEGLLSR